MTLLYFKWCSIPRWLLRSMFVLFREQLLNGKVSWGSLGKYSLIECFLGDAFGVLSCLFWNTVLQCGDLLPIHTLNYWTVQWCQFFTRGVFECDLAHRLWQYYVCCTKSGVTQCTLCSAIPVPYLPVRVTRVGVIAHRDTYAASRWRTSQYRKTFIPFSVSLWNDFGDPVFDGVGLEGCKSRANAFLLAKLLSPFLSPAGFPSASFILWVGIAGLWSSDSGC